MGSVRKLGWLALLTVAFTASAQQPAAAPERFPYVFSNFVWWSDAGLRQELARRIHTLPAEITRNSAEEREIRKALTKLLHKNGVHAEAQVIEPREGTVRLAGDPPAAIVFRVIAPPEIDVESVAVAPGLPGELDGEVKELNRTLVAHQYAAETFWWREHRLESILAEQGYLTAKAELTPDEPRAGADGKVQVRVIVAAKLGPQFHVGEVAVDGGPLLEGRDLRRYVAIHTGDVATTRGFVRLEASLRLLYQQKGYVDVSFLSEPTLDVDRSLANYHFRVVPGTQFQVGKVEINGLSPAQSGEAREALGLKPGDLFNQRALSELYRKLRSSPTLLHETFSYTVQRDEGKSTVELTLDFSHER